MSSDNALKILVSTDNHLGYRERDPIRYDDSFRAFEEVLQLARANQADLLLLAGDLFHQNTPSRKTLHKTMRLLRENCLSHPSQLKVLSPSPAIHPHPGTPVSLPVFVIHGNHDDPTGGPPAEALSTLDLLATAGLVTYFGRPLTSAAGVFIPPVLLRKQNNALALYGLGNLRDDALHHVWARQDRVQFPPPSPACPPIHPSEELNWFKIFVLHQNRYTRGTSQAISETLLPPWLDYVVWGHEHRSLPDLAQSKPPISQPGSTVVTSLCASESYPKHAILLEVCDGKLKSHRAMPLLTVRNYQFRDVVLSEQDGLAERERQAICSFLEATVEEMIAKQELAFDAKLRAFQNGTSREEVNGVRYPPCSFYLEKLTPLVRQPLVRLRVEITGDWDTPSPQSFGRGYIGRVACPWEMLLFYRTKRLLPLKRSRTFLQGRSDGPQVEVGDGDSDEDVDFSRNKAGEQNTVPIAKLVLNELHESHAQDPGLSFLEVDRLSGAVDEFVNKEVKDAIPKYLNRYLKLKQVNALEEAAASGICIDEAKLLQEFKRGAIAAFDRFWLESGPREVGKVRDGNGKTSAGAEVFGAGDFEVRKTGSTREAQNQTNPPCMRTGSETKVTAGSAAALETETMLEDALAVAEKG